MEAKERNNTEDRDMSLMLLRSWDANAIFMIYIFIFFVGLYVAVTETLIYAESPHKERNALIAGIAISLLGSTIFYTRKLYQACINNTYTFIINSKLQLTETQLFRRKGTVAFFLMRPIFGMAFSLVTYAFWRLSIAASDESSLTPSTGFLYTTLTLGFLSGFLSGRMLTLLEGYGTSRLSPMVGIDD